MDRDFGFRVQGDIILVTPHNTKLRSASFHFNCWSMSYSLIYLSEISLTFHISHMYLITF